MENTYYTVQQCVIFNFQSILETLNRHVISIPIVINSLIADYAKLHIFDCALLRSTSKVVHIQVMLNDQYQYSFNMRRAVNQSTFGEIKRSVARRLQCDATDIEWKCGADYGDECIIYCDNVLFVKEHPKFILPLDPPRVQVKFGLGDQFIEFVKMQKSVTAKLNGWSLPGSILLASNHRPHFAARIQVFNFHGKYKVLSIAECDAIVKCQTGAALDEAVLSNCTPFEISVRVENDFWESFIQAIQELTSRVTSLVIYRMAKPVTLITHCIDQEVLDLNGMFSDINRYDRVRHCTFTDTIFMVRTEFLVSMKNEIGKSREKYW